MSWWYLGEAQAFADTIVVGVDSEGDSLVWVLVELVFQPPVAGLTHYSGSTLVTTDSDVNTVNGVNERVAVGVVDPVEIFFLIGTIDWKKYARYECYKWIPCPVVPVNVVDTASTCMRSRVRYKRRNNK